MQPNLNALIVFGTRYGATAGTAEEIGKNLCEKGFKVKLANLKEEKIQDLTQYKLVVVGSGMAMGNWTSEAEDFVKKHQKDLENRKLALFISSLKPVEEKTGNTKAVARIQKIGLDEKIAKYHLNPITVRIFGGIINYPKISVLFRKAVEIGYKSKLKENGFKEIEPDVYDLRNWDEIRDWAKELAERAQS